MITIEPDRDNRVKIGDQYYRPIIIKVECEQDFPRDIPSLAKEQAIRLEEEKMIQKLNSAINEHITTTGVIRGGHLHTHKVELMILKPIKNGRRNKKS